MERQEIDQHKCSRLIFDKEAKAIQWRKDTLFKNNAGTTGHSHGKNLETDLVSFTKIISKWITSSLGHSKK